MKKVVLIMILILTGLCINVGFVYAEGGYNGSYRDDSDIASKPVEINHDEKCKSTFGDPNDEKSFAYNLQQVFNIIRFLGPVLVLLVTIKDLISVTADQKQDGELKKIGIKTLKRIIYAVILFMLPVIISTIFHLIGLYGTCIS